jgi:hypothetical protein
MKNCVLVALLLILLLNDLFGEVKNGYENEVANVKSSIQGLKDVLLNSKDLSVADKRKIKIKIRTLINYLTYSQITETLLQQFRAIAPDIYNEIDLLEDCQGRIVDVYVKFISQAEAKVAAAGMASFAQSEYDLNSCHSEYGVRSISVKVWILNNALCVLSHEFGHIKYVVPNLRSYVEFYKNKYPRGLSEPNVGHRSDDPSGKVASEFEQRYRQCYVKYIKADLTPVRSPLALVNPIRRSLSENLRN